MAFFYEENSYKSALRKITNAITVELNSVHKIMKFTLVKYFTTSFFSDTI